MFVPVVTSDPEWLLTRAHELAVNCGQLTSVRALTRQARRLAEDTGDADAIMNAEYILGVALAGERCHEELLYLAERNLLLSQRSDEPRSLVHQAAFTALRGVIPPSYSLGEDMLDSALSAASLLHDSGEESFLAHCVWRDVGALLTISGMYDDADTAFRQALDIADRIEISAGTVIASRGIGTVSRAIEYSHLGNDHMAEELFDQGYHQCIQAPWVPDVLESHNHRLLSQIFAVVALARLAIAGRRLDAHQLLPGHLEEIKRLGHASAHMEAFGLYAQAHAYLALGKINDSLDILLEMDVHQLIPQVAPLNDAEAPFLRSLAYQRLGNLPRAFDEYREFHRRIHNRVAADQQRRYALAVARRDRERLQITLDDYRNKARHDALTGLPNRREFESVYTEWMGHARKQGTPLWLGIGDCDSFKSVNDHYGHLIGDAVLVACAEILTTNIRAESLVARYAGDEFVIVVLGVDMQTVTHIDERYEEAFEAYPWDNIAPALSVSMTFGWAYWRPGMAADDLFMAADEQLLIRKSSRSQSHCTRHTD